MNRGWWFYDCRAGQENAQHPWGYLAGAFGEVRIFLLFICLHIGTGSPRMGMHLLATTQPES